MQKFGSNLQAEILIRSRSPSTVNQTIEPRPKYCRNSSKWAGWYKVLIEAMWNGQNCNIPICGIRFTIDAGPNFSFINLRPPLWALAVLWGIKPLQVWYSTERLHLFAEISTDYGSQSNLEFPQASISNSALIGSFAFNDFTAACISLVFTPALFCDLWWPERIEAIGLQSAWQLAALFAAICQLLACMVTTIVVATKHVSVSGISPGDKPAFEQTWTSKPLIYKHYTIAVVAIIMCWIAGISALYRWVKSEICGRGIDCDSTIVHM